MTDTEDVWAKHLKDMIERVGPEIEANLRKRARDAVELRHGRQPEARA